MRSPPIRSRSSGATRSRALDEPSAVGRVGFVVSERACYRQSGLGAPNPRVETPTSSRCAIEARPSVNLTRKRTHGSSAHQDVIDAFPGITTILQEQTRENNSWLGVKTWKAHDLGCIRLCTGSGPTSSSRPAPTGVSAYFMAVVFDLIGRGRVSRSTSTRTATDPSMHGSEYIRGSSVDATVLARVRQEAARSDTVLVILDSDHHRDHVLAELREYSGIVTPGSYLIVEDTNINGHPVRPEYGPGPREAVESFLADTSDFIPDTACEKFLLTWNSGGYLRRIPGQRGVGRQGRP